MVKIYKKLIVLLTIICLITPVRAKGYTGFNVISGKLYYFNNGVKVKNKTVRNVRFLSTGVGINKLETSIYNKVILILKSKNALNKSKSKKLKILWKYLISHKNFSYYTKYPNMKSSTWVKDYALYMLNNKKGNCYGFACTFAAMAYVIGYNPKVVCGRVRGSRDRASDGYTRHACVKIGKYYYDPEAAFAHWLSKPYKNKSIKKIIKSKKYYTYASQDGDKKNLTVTSDGNYYHYIENNKYYGFNANNQALTGVYYYKNMIFNFNKSHYMSVSDQKTLQSQIKKNSSYETLKNTIGTVSPTTSSTEEGENNTYTYSQIIVNTYKPLEGEEIITSIKAR